MGKYNLVQEEETLDEDIKIDVEDDGDGEESDDE